MTAVQTAPHAFHQTFDWSGHRSLIADAFHFLLDVLKYQSYYNHTSYEERAESKTSKVVSKHPPVPTANTVISSVLVVSILTEVPRGNSNDLDIVGRSDDEGAYPKEHEEGEVDHILFIVRPSELFVCE